MYFQLPGRDQTLTTRGVYREIIMTFYFNQNNVNVNDSNTVVLFRFCQELPSLSAYEMHPDNLKLMLNGKTLVEPVGFVRFFIQLFDVNRFFMVLLGFFTVIVGYRRF
jgi:hypothetical protein